MNQTDGLEDTEVDSVGTDLGGGVVLLEVAEKSAKRAHPQRDALKRT